MAQRVRPVHIEQSCHTPQVARYCDAVCATSGDTHKPTQGRKPSPPHASARAAQITFRDRGVRCHRARVGYGFIQGDVAASGSTRTWSECDRATKPNGVAHGHVGREPVVLMSLPGTRQQLAHVDATSKSVPRDVPPMVGLFLSLEPNTRAVVYPGLRHKHCRPGVPVVLPMEVEAPCGTCFLFRGDLVHCGASNPFSSVHRRIHCYVHRTDMPTSTWSGQGHIFTPSSPA